jgi:hypothetical protein
MELTLNTSDCGGRSHVPSCSLFILPKITPNAQIITYNLNGTQLKSIELHHIETGNIIVYSNKLKGGMSMYSMITDDKVVGTKRMVLTK